MVGVLARVGVTMASEGNLGDTACSLHRVGAEGNLGDTARSFCRVGDVNTEGDELGSPLVVVDTLILVEGTTVETLNNGDKGGEAFEHTRDSVVLFRVGASKSEYLVGRDFLKKVVIGGIVSYHLLPDDFQLDTNKVRHGKNHIWNLSDNSPSYVERDKIWSLFYR
jgi:hypothetical protein